MIRFRSSLLAASLIALALNTDPAQSQQARSFVSGLGNDANAPNCTRTAPCRTFQKAHDSTIPSGEITVLDAGSYGGVIINRNISIINDGVGEAGALVSGGGVGITVNAGANDRVSLRGLTIKGLDPQFGGSNGIKFISAASLTVENCAIRNMTGDGIEMLGDLPSGTISTFTLSNTFVSDNGGNGIYIQPTGSGRLRVLLNRVEIYNNLADGLGIAVTGLNSAVVTDSVSANNLQSGFVMFGGSQLPCPSLTIIRSLAYSNGKYGAQADLCSYVVLTDNVMTDNFISDWGFTNGGIVISYGGNLGSGNISFSNPKQ